MAYAAAGGQAAGGIFGAFGSIVQGQSISNMLDYQAKIQDSNATNALAAAKFDADKQSLTANRIMGSAIAGYGASGVESSSGSALAVLAASAANAELDRQNILHGGDIRAINYENQSSMDRFSGEQAIKSSYFNAASSLSLSSAKIGTEYSGASAGGGDGG